MVVANDQDRGSLPSASGGAKLYHCAGSFLAEKLAPETAPSDEALEGQAIHEALETDDFTALDDAGKNIADRLSSMMEQARDEWAFNLGLAPSQISEFREKRLWVKSRAGKPISSAKIDRCYLAPPHALIVDTKTGYLRSTPSEKNIQCRIQALAVASHHTNISHILSGTASYRFSGKVDLCEYDRDTINSLLTEHEFMIWRAENPHAERVPGDHCRYCKAQSSCLEAATYSMLPMPLTQGMAKIKDEEIAAIVNRQPLDVLAHVHRHKAIATKVFEAITARLKSLPAEELLKVGLVKADDTQVREIKDVKRAWALLFEHMTGEEFAACCDIVIGRIEATLIPKMIAADPKLTKKAAKEMVNDIIAPVVTMAPRAGRLMEAE